MSQLQAAIEFQVELGKFYNVDLFQRGYYQVRTTLKISPKTVAKVDVSFSSNSVDNKLVMPAVVCGAAAISKTFQILYRKEEVELNDIILFKVHTLVDINKLEECLKDADFQLLVELWFSEEDIRNGSVQPACITERTLKLHLSPSKGIHHHVPLLFDYFHLAAVFITVHASLLSIHQPYISRSQTNSSVIVTTADKSDDSCMQYVIFVKLLLLIHPKTTQQ